MALSTKTWKVLIKKNKSYEKTVAALPQSLGSTPHLSHCGILSTEHSNGWYNVTSQVRCKHTWPLTEVFACEPMDDHLSCIKCHPGPSGSSHFLTLCLATCYLAKAAALWHHQNTCLLWNVSSQSLDQNLLQRLSCRLWTYSTFSCHLHFSWEVLAGNPAFSDLGGSDRDTWFFSVQWNFPTPVSCAWPRVLKYQTSNYHQRSTWYSGSESMVTCQQQCKMWTLLRVCKAEASFINKNYRK